MAIYARNRLLITGTDYLPENNFEFPFSPIYKVTVIVQGESVVMQVAEDRPSNFGPKETTEQELLQGTHSRTFPKGNIHGFRLRSRSSKTATVWIVAYGD